MFVYHILIISGNIKKKKKKKKGSEGSGATSSSSRSGPLPEGVEGIFTYLLCKGVEVVSRPLHGVEGSPPLLFLGGG